MPDHQYSIGIYIRHPAGDSTFVDRASQSLDKIFSTGAGASLQTALQNNFSVRGHRVVIREGTVSLCRGGGLAARSLLAQEIIDGHNGAAGVGAEINACLAASGHAGNHGWLATQINNAPVYTLQGSVTGIPSNLGVVAADVNNWINNATWPNTVARIQRSQLERAVLAALWPWARNRPGGGTSALVEWNVNSGSITTTTGVHMNRSKSIGLAHELVHACYDGQGLQMGVDNGHDTTALYEYQCVGLGMWAGEPYSENAIRAQWQTVVSHTLFGGRAPVRYRAVAARPAY